MLTYLVVTAVLVATPGLATAVVIRNTLEGGRSAGLATALGIAAANSSYALLASIGVAAFIGGRPVAMSAVQKTGAIFLAVLATQSLLRAVRSSGHSRPASPLPRRRAIVQGFVTNALNPSIAVFYATYVPQFTGGASGFVGSFALLAAIHVGMALSVHSTYALSLGRLAEVAMRPGVKRTLDAIAGMALLALAARALR